MAGITEVDLSIQNVSKHSVTVSLVKMTSGGDTGELRVLEKNSDTIVNRVNVTLTSQASVYMQLYGLSAGAQYRVAFFSNTVHDYTSGMVLFTTLTGDEKLLYGPVSNRATKVNTLYGSHNGQTRIINKLYGSVNGRATLTYFSLGEIPRPGIVTYYTDNTYTTTATARIITQAELDSMTSGSYETDTWTTTLDGVEISNKMIKEVTMPTWATATPNYFLVGCSRLDTFNYSVGLNTLGDGFLAKCSTFNKPIDLTNITTIGARFLRACTRFNQPLDISKFTSVPTEFLMGCSAFNQPLDTSNLSNIGSGFLRSCSSFNQPLDLSSAVTIGNNFLSYANSFNQRLEIPSSVTNVYQYFLYNAKNMTSPIILNVPASVASSSDYSFSTDDNTANIYTQGVQLAGYYAQEWKTKFPNRSTTPYRNVGYASLPVLYLTEITENDSSTLFVEYGVSVWDINGAYTTGTVTLSESVSGGAYSQVDSKTSTGENTYTKPNIVGNTQYSYKVEATNSGNENIESETSYVTKPQALTITSENVGYSTYNKFVRKYNVRIPANGGFYTQNISYRLKKTTDSDYGEWVSLGSYSSPSANVANYHNITLDTDVAYTIQFRTSTTAGETITEYAQSAIPAHEGISSVEFTYDDANTEVQDWLSTFSGYSGGNWFVGGQSLPRVTIPQETSGDVAIDYKYIQGWLYGYSASVPAVGSVMTNTGSLPTSMPRTITASLNGYLAFRIQITNSTDVGNRLEDVRQEVLDSFEVIDPTTDENIFDGTTWFGGYFNNSTDVSARTIRSSDARNTIIYVPCVSGRKYTVRFKTTGATKISQYEATITRPNTGYSAVIPYTSETDMSYTFEKEALADTQTSGITTVMLEAEDSLDTVTTFYQGGTYLSWSNPTFNGTAQRLGELGALRINFNGSYSALQIDALNNGKDLNSIKVEYRVTDYAGRVITDWTTVDEEDVRIMPNTGSVLNRNYSGSIRIVNFEYTKSLVVDIRASDHFEVAGTIGIPLNLWEEEQKLQPVTYEIEIWDWKTNTYVADLSTLVVGDLSIDWELNDIEEIEFSIDLLQFEERCKDMGVNPKEILTPYKHDIRIRRNDKYILGCQLVEANVQVPNNSPVLINIKCTGYLNLFKDQYILDEAWSGYTYAEIARKLVLAAQKPDCLIKNPTGDIDTSYWLAANGTVYSSTASYSGDRCIMGSRSGTGYITIGTQMEVDSGEEIVIDVWVKGQNGVVCQIRERQYVTQSSNQENVLEFTLDGNWQHIQTTYKTFWQDGYIVIEMNRTNSNTNLYIDDCYIYAQNDNYYLCDLNVPLGVDTASNTQQKTRQVNYSLQNIKDAIIDLTNMEDDNFDFDFSYDRTFNCYAQKGTEKLDVEITYPGNVESINIGRSAANLANKIYRIGSGIGDERLQVDVNNTPSRQIYGTRESIVTDSNVELESTLLAQAIGDLYDRKDPTNLPTVTVRDGSVNPDIVQVGDYVPVSIQGDGFLDTINDIYRIVKISLSVDEDAVETMKMTFEPPVKRPEKKMIRYIRDSLTGCSKDTSKQWNEIQALVLVGNEFINVAQGATVYGSSAFSSSHGGDLITDGNINTYANMTAQVSREAITIDLGAEYPVDYVQVWHYHQDGRAMRGEHLSVGLTLPEDDVNGIADLETLLWAYDENNGYTETSEGKRSRWLQEGQVVDSEVSDSVHMIRYIRESHDGCSLDTTGTWAEIDAQMFINGANKDAIKQGTKIFFSDAMTSASGAEGLYAPIDGDVNTWVSSGGDRPRRRRSITVDLGALYPVDYIKLFHWYSASNPAVFYESHLSVGKELPGEANGLEDLETVLWADAPNSGILDTAIGRRSSSIQALPNNVTVENPRMVRYIKDTYTRNSVNDQKAWHYVCAYMRDPETGSLRDLAMGLTPTFTDTVTNPKNATDDVEDTFASVLATGPQSIIIDLGDEYPIDYVRVLHHGDGKTTYGNRLSVGTTLTSGNEPLETTIWDDGGTVGFVERSKGRWSGWIQDENPRRIFHAGNKRPVRYIRDSIAGSSANSASHWVEIQAWVYDHERWVNVALNKPVTASFTPNEGTPSRVTDGNIDSGQYVGWLANNTPGAVTVDLGQEYYIDYVQVRHYYADGRTYNSPVLSVGSTLPDNDDGKQALEWVLNTETYVERAAGLISKWVQGDL